MLSQQQAKKHILRMLKRDVHNSTEFCQLLQKTDAYIMGSYALQGITGKTWPSDIDIYVSDKPVFKDVKIKGDFYSPKLVNELSKLGCALRYGISDHFYSGVTTFSDQEYKTNDITKVCDYICNRDIEMCENCKGGKSGSKEDEEKTVYGKCCVDYTADKYGLTKIQIIFINHFKYTPKQFCQRYDLDFCKVIFDGDKFEVLCPEAVKTRTSKYNRVSDWKNQKQARIKKYTARGFTITE